MGTCVYHIAHQGIMQKLGNAGMNVELTNYTQALYDARELAMERMQKEAHRDQAEGIVGVRIEDGSYGWASHVIEFFAVGTSVIADENNRDKNISNPQLVMLLNDNR